MASLATSTSCCFQRFEAWGFCGGVGGVAGATKPGGLRRWLYSRSSLVCSTDGRRCFGRHHGSHTARSGQAPHTPGGTEVDHGTLRRHSGLCAVGMRSLRGLGSRRSGRFGDTVWWVCVVYAGWTSWAAVARDASAIPCAGVRDLCGQVGLGSRRSGQPLGSGCARRWAARHHLVDFGTLWPYQGPCVWQSQTSGQSGTFGTLRYHAIGVWSSRAMQVWAATVGTLRRYHPSGRNGQLHRWDALATPWSVSWLAFCIQL